MTTCHILPPYYEINFQGATGCTKPVGHDGPHDSTLKDGSVIEWETDWECECCIEEEIPDMCFVWKKKDEGKAQDERPSETDHERTDNG